MAAADVGSNKVLWQFITGGSILRPRELVQAEITRSKQKLLEGFLALKKCSGKPGDGLKAKKKLSSGHMYEFVLKFSKFVNLEEVLAYNIFQTYLENDYRGTDEELETSLKDDRYSYPLLLKLRDYYFSERLYLLLCIKHILSHWQDDEHPYKNQYVSFVESVTENDKLIEKIIKQYTSCCTEVAPTWETHGQAMSDHQVKIWMAQTLKEQCAFLEILLLYYKDIQHAAKDLLVLLKQFKEQGFGRHQTNKHLIDRNLQHLVSRIGHLQVMILIEGLDLEHLYRLQSTNSIHDHHIVKASEFDGLDKILCTLGDQVDQAPLLLAWTTMRHLIYDTKDAVTTRRLGNVSLRLRVFDNLLVLLKSEPFCGKSVISSVCQFIVYSLLCIVLTAFHEDTLGDTEGLYAVTEQVVKRPFISEDVWEKGFTKGVGMLVQSASLVFPLEFHHFIRLCTSLSNGEKEDKEGANKVMEMLKHLPVYTEYLDQNKPRDVMNVNDDQTWRLRNNKYPFPNARFMIPKGTYATRIPHSDRAPAIQWEHTYDGWQLLYCECEVLIEQVSQGAGMVQASSVEKVLDIMKLVNTIVDSDNSLSVNLNHITKLVFPLIHRFSSLSSPPLDLIASCLDVLASLAESNSKQIWHELQHTGFLPYLTENYTNEADMASESGLNPGTYGLLLSTYEITLGTYPVTLAYLNLIANIIKPLSTEKNEQTLLSSLLFIIREIFPVFQKWRYYDVGRRETIGQKCLDIFHKILNVEENGSGNNSVKLRDLCMHCLLYMESGRALLDIIAIGIDTIEVALAQQGSASEGIGIDIIQQIRFAFSVLNRLLMLQPATASPSPVEQALSTQPANLSQRHIIATIAQYIYHRHDPRLPALATLLLKRLAMVSPMSLMACLGKDSSCIRDIFLSRLQSYTEDIRLKVVILELLSVCVETQPGLIEMFLNIKHVKKTNKKADDGKPKELELDKISCLRCVLSLLNENQQIVCHCPPDLLCAVTEFIHALWFGRRETAMSVLRNENDFWDHVCTPLRSDLPLPESTDVVALSSDIKTVSFVIRILALELYGMGSSKLDPNLEKVLSTIVKENRIIFWSEYIRDMLKKGATAEHSDTIDLNENSSIHLLYGWRSFLLVLASYKGSAISLDEKTKCALLSHVLLGLRAQFDGDLERLKMKLAAIASNLYFTLIKHWIGCLKAFDPTVTHLTNILREMSASMDILPPFVQIGVPGSLLLILQYSHQNNKDISKQCLMEVLHLTCTLVVNGAHKCYQWTDNSSTSTDVSSSQIKSQFKNKSHVLLLNVLHELVLILDVPSIWLPVLQQNMIIPTLLSALQHCIQVKQGAHYVEAIILLFQSFAKLPVAAEIIASNNVSQHLCLCVTQLYTRERYPSDDITAKNKCDSDIPNSIPPTWLGIYRLILNLVSQMLGTLRYTFLQDALDFVGVHQDRLIQSLASIKLSLVTPLLMEAETTCNLLYVLSHYQREWRLHLPLVWAPMVTGVCDSMQTCISLLIRPRLLQHVLEKNVAHEGIGSNSSPSQLSLSNLSTRLQTQSSTEEDVLPSKSLVNGQYYLLRILAQGFSFLRKFSPDLCQITIDQSMDISEYELLLDNMFSTPSIDQDNPLSFGTILACLNQVLRFLTKLDGRATSPAKTSSISNTNDISPISRTLLMYILENGLIIVMSQALRYLKDITHTQRDKQFLKRELGTELNSFIQGFQRYIKRSGPQSPGGPTLNRSISQTSQTGAQSQEQKFFKLIDAFVQQVLR